MHLGKPLSSNAFGPTLTIPASAVTRIAEITSFWLVYSVAHTSSLAGVGTQSAND
jgi:hypothetical protein